MKHPLVELRRLLAPPGPTTGVVVGFTPAGEAQVATQRGLVLASAAEAVKKGDSVTVKEGEALPAPKAKKRYPV